MSEGPPNPTNPTAPPPPGPPKGQRPGGPPRPGKRPPGAPKRPGGPGGPGAGAGLFSDPKVTRIALGVGGAVLVLILVVVLLSGGSDDSEDAGDAETSDAPTAADVSTSASTTTTIVRVTASPDDFNRESADGLGSGPPPYVWQTDAGTWAIQDGSAVATAAPDGGAAITTVDLGTGNAIAQMLAREPAKGAALVFRYQDPQNYWSYQFGEGFFGTVTIWKYVDGERVKVKDSNMIANAGDAFGVRAVGPTLTFFIKGLPVYETNDPYLANATRFGLAASGDAVSNTRFDDVIFEPVTAAPAPTATDSTAPTTASP